MYKKIYIFILIIICLLFAYNVEAKRSRINNYIGTGSNPFSNKVNGYFKNNGTYVDTHQRSKRNKTEFDNWSTRGNYNLYTGKRGSRSPRW